MFSAQKGYIRFHCCTFLVEIFVLFQNERSHPIQPGCRVYSVVPDPIGTCGDGIKNRDEEDVDCGGRFCEPCPVLVYEGDYFR